MRIIAFTDHAGNIERILTYLGPRPTQVLSPRTQSRHSRPGRPHGTVSCIRGPPCVAPRPPPDQSVAPATPPRSSLSLAPLALLRHSSGAFGDARGLEPSRDSGSAARPKSKFSSPPLTRPADERMRSLSVWTAGGPDGLPNEQ